MPLGKDILSTTEFIKQSLGLHLFFARIMKEHSFFLEVGFTPRDANFTQRTDELRREFDGILEKTVALSNGVVSPEVLQSGEVVTPFTLKAERATTFYTGIQIPIQLTQAEEGLAAGNILKPDPKLERHVFDLNQRAIKATAALIKFKKDILSNVLNCDMFTFNYPLLILHITREAELYLEQLRRLQRGRRINLERDALELEFFWNRQMAEHAKFIRGLLDPSENNLIDQADIFGKEFDKLTKEAKAAINATLPKGNPLSNLTAKSLKATEDLRNFKAQGTQGILACKIRSIIIPLLGDHVLREANHYLRLLRMFKK